MSEKRLWPLVRAERANVVTALEALPEDQWTAATLCSEWSVHDVAGHLVAASNAGTLAWLINFAVSRFNPDRHNARLLAKHRGADPHETLQRLRASIPLEVGPLGSAGGMLGEVVVHGRDIARPLGLDLAPSMEAQVALAEFFAAKDFAVNSATVAKGLRLEASDSDFRAGPADAPVVQGTTLALIMAMAGRPDVLVELSGDGVSALCSRLEKDIGRP